MAQTPPPTIDPVPSPAPQRGDRATFSDRVDAFVTWLSAAVAQFGALATNVYNNAVDAFNSAVASAGSATTSATQAGNASTSAGAAAGSATAAANSASAAASSAAAAASSAAGLIGTSSTSVIIGAGSKAFVTQTGKQFQANVSFEAVDQANVANKLSGYVDSYSGSNLVMIVTSFTGSGTISAWNLSVAGARGATGSPGGLTGGNLTGALNDAKAADVDSTVTPSTLDIWSGAGNFEILTNSGTITGFSAAPQAGAERTVLIGGTPTLTAGANMIIKGVASGSSITLTAGDEVRVRAETTTKFRITIVRGDGQAMVSSGTFRNTLRWTSSGSFTARVTGWHRITLTGSGGRGGAVFGTTQARATGAGAAGLCIGMRYLTAGVTYTIIVGAGAADLGISANGTYAGANGSASSFLGSGITTMTANGGGAGQTSATATAVAGGVGGTAAGGDINLTGGKGGDISGSAVFYFATGGGAIALQGVAYNAGNVIANAVNIAATGGAGVGGGSGNATSSVGGAGAALSGGGGAGGASPATTDSIGAGSPNFAQTVAGGVAAYGDIPAVLFNATAGGNAGNTPLVAGRSGAGGSAAFSNNMGATGDCAGGGGYAYDTGLASNTDATKNGRGGRFGGGSGGFAARWSSGTITIAGSDSGVCIIEFN